jgi:hypothetical protein
MMTVAVARRRLRTFSDDADPSGTVDGQNMPSSGRPRCA